jgi:hypothetical protein
VEGDPAAVEHLRDPLVEVFADETLLVGAVDEQQLDRFVEIIGGPL